MRPSTLNQWSLEEIRTLRNLAAQGAPAHWIASELRRSEFAVRNKAGMHGISLKGPGSRKSVPPERKAALEAPADESPSS